MAADQLLTTPAGRAVARFQRRVADDGRPMADLVELLDGVDAGDAVPAMVAAFRGWRVAAPPVLARELLHAGARPQRHAYVMSRDLRRDPVPAEWLAPALPPGFRLTPVERPAADLAAACAAAYPPGHPDHRPEPAERELDALMSGRLLGPLLPCSALALAPDGAVAGAVLVNDSDGDPPFGGPWVSQLYRRPEARGTGVALLRRALAGATRDGLPAIGLAVTHGNPARARYAEHGFAEVSESLSVDL